MSSRADLVVWALTGQRVVVRPGSVVARLAAIGWDGAAVAEFRDACVAAGRQWPIQPDAAEVESHAALAAGIGDARRELGLDETVVARQTGRPLSADERRLVADRPPHW